MKFKLVEDINLEESKKYNLSPLLKDTLLSAMKGLTNAERGQTKLKRHLCLDRNVYYPSFYDLDVHHIDGNHFNDRDNNLALIEHSKHIALHKRCLNQVLEELCNEVDEGGPGYVELEDLHPNIFNIVHSRYIELLKLYVDEYRLDK